MFLHADSEDSDQTVRMSRLIQVFTGRTGHFVGFVSLGSNLLQTNISMTNTVLSTYLRA